MIIENNERFEKYIKPFIAEDGEDPDPNESFRCAIDIEKIIVNNKVKAKSYLFFSAVRLKILVVTNLRLFILEERTNGFFRRTPVILFKSEMLRSQLAGVFMEYSERRPKLYINSKADERWILRASTKEDISGTYKILKKMQVAVAKKDNEKKSELKKLKNHALVKYSDAVTKMSESFSENLEARKQAKDGQPTGNE